MADKLKEFGKSIIGYPDQPIPPTVSTRDYIQKAKSTNIRKGVRILSVFKNCRELTSEYRFLTISRVYFQCFNGLHGTTLVGQLVTSLQVCLAARRSMFAY